MRTPASAAGRSRAPTRPILKRSRPALSSTANPLQGRAHDPRPTPATEAVLDRADRRSYPSDPLTVTHGSGSRAIFFPLARLDSRRSGR